MRPDDFALLRALHRDFGGERFTLAQVHRITHKATSKFAKPWEDAEYRDQLARLEGYVEASAGPRGGKGYVLTGRGIKCVERLESRSNG